MLTFVFSDSVKSASRAEPSAGSPRTIRMEHGAAQPALIGQQVGKAIHAVIFLPDHAALSRRIHALAHFLTQSNNQQPRHIYEQRN
jgi:hypothetical protein